MNIGIVEYYSGFAWPVYDCLQCRCRFTLHDERVYDELHRDSGSCYNVYRGLQERCTEAFMRGDLSALRKELYNNAKYRFVIEEVDRLPKNTRILEIGCSRGYLTSYFILAGYQVTGADVSESAILAARTAFGNHFAVIDEIYAQEMKVPYDLIYHVGTIGCVADPLTLTRRLLERVGSRGRLLFNAPNLHSCLRGQLWIDAAPPPDLVTIFPPGFWKQQFSSEAQVEEQVEHCGSSEALSIGLRNLARRRWKQPTPIALNKSSERYISGSVAPNKKVPLQDRAWQHFEKGCVKVASVTGLQRLAPSQPTPFGLFVKMVRK